MSMPDEFPGQEPLLPGFEVEDQLTQDLVLLVGLADDLGGDLQAASGIVCNATVISGVELDTKEYTDIMNRGRKRGTLKPEIMALSDDAFEEHVAARAHDFVQSDVDYASSRLSERLGQLEDQAATDRATALLKALGVEVVPDGFQAIKRDEERVAAIIKVAKLMDVGYREFVAMNPEFMAGRDPESVAELEGVDVIDPRVKQILRELRYEL